MGNSYMSKRIIITGSSSRFAKSLKKKIVGKNIFYTDRKKLNILDIKSIEKNFKKLKPKILIHIAGLSRPMNIHDKHINKSIDKNIIGTCNIVKICKKYNVKKFVLVSTDKAINPTNIMGASKRLAEILCNKLQQKNGTKFITVRFGNVLGSSGSVIPLFKKQIAKGGPITVTDPKITRYFMAITEAAQLVLQAGLIGEGEDIFVLEMGNPIRILDLAKDMINLSGFQEGEIEIQFTGLRKGEKLYEELLADDEKTKPTSHTKIRIANVINKVEKIQIQKLVEWINSTKDMKESLIKKQLTNWVKEYNSSNS